MISRDRVRAVTERMVRLGIARDDLEEEFIRGSGAGGQKINKTASTVRLRHWPTGTEVRCQEERSLAQNRLLARERLCDIIETRRTRAAAAARQAKEKERRRRRQRTPAQKRRMVEEKRRQGLVKQHRRKPGADE